MAALTIADDEAALAQSTAERITTLIEGAAAAHGSAIVSLTGGSTPRELYALLADGAHTWRDRIPWARVHLFWGDERHVPPDHEDSNFGMAATAMIRRVPIPEGQVHRMRGEIADAAEAAREYARELAAGFSLAGRADRTFDVMLLGLGEDAHIASIFPGSELLTRRPVKGRPTTGDADHERPPVEARSSTKTDDVGRVFTARLGDEDRVAAVWASHLGAWRITLTPGAILDARAIVMVVAGASKADAVRAALEEPPDVTRRPAQLLREAKDRVEWFVDRAAAAHLKSRKF